MQLPSRPPPQQVSSLDAWSELIGEMYGRHASPTAIFDRLRLEHPDFPGSLSAVKRLCARIRRARGILPDSAVFGAPLTWVDFNGDYHVTLTPSVPVALAAGAGIVR